MEFLSFGKSGMLLNNSIHVGIITTVTVGFVNEFDLSSIVPRQTCPIHMNSVRIFQEDCPRYEKWQNLKKKKVHKRM